MSRVLVVFENVPERTDFYALDATPTELEKLKLCHGNFINLDCGEESEDELNWLSTRLVEPDVRKIDDKLGPIALGDFDLLVLTGCMM